MFFYKKKRKNRGKNKNKSSPKKYGISCEQMEAISHSIINKKRLLIYTEKM